MGPLFRILLTSLVIYLQLLGKAGIHVPQKSLPIHMIHMASGHGQNYGRTLVLRISLIPRCIAVEPILAPTESLVLPPPDAFNFDSKLSFPREFIFGLAVSVAKIEGAIAEEGRSPTIMENYTVDDRPKDCITNENYYLYEQDIVRLAAMGVKHYYFSIPWTRVLPFVLPGTPVNQQGIDHYDDLINTCLEYA